MKIEILEELNKLTIEKWWDCGNFEEIRDIEFVANNLDELFESALTQKQKDIDELVAELEKIKKYGVSDLELDILIKKHTKK